MDFFKSLISDDPDPNESAPDSPTNQSESDHEDNDDVDDEVDGDHQLSSGGLWSFGGLMQTIATRSESVLETYRRDLQEFGTGLKKETEILREAASKSVKDLPASIDGVIKSTAEIISHGKESLLAASDEMETPDTNRSRNSVLYSRFEAQLNFIQNDVKTYTEEVEDLEEYGKWKSGFALIDKGEEIASLIGEGGGLEGMHKRTVPNEVDNETFWFRYFYRVHKLQQQESVRAKLVRRAISIDDEEELSWDVDDDDEDDDDIDGDGSVGEGSVVKEKGDELGKKKDPSEKGVDGIEKEDDRKRESLNVSGNNVGENMSNVESVVELKSRDESDVKNEEKLVKPVENSGVKKDEKVEKTDEKVEKSEKVEKPEEKVAISEKVEKPEEKVVKSEEVEKPVNKVDKPEEEVQKSEKEVPVSVYSSKESKMEEEDLEWDEIGDVDSNDEKKTAGSGQKSNEADLRKRLSTADEDEDLSWDIEDDD